MNERIKELLNQTSAWGPGGATMDRYNFHVSDVEKFAELILADYAKQLVQANMSNHWYVQAMDEHYEQKWAHRFG
jgi:hypothetical protein